MTASGIADDIPKECLGCPPFLGQIRWPKVVGALLLLLAPLPYYRSGIPGYTNALRTLPLRWDNFRREIVTVVHTNGNGSMPFLRSANYRSCIAWSTGYYSPKEVKRISGKKLICFSCKSLFTKQESKKITSLLLCLLALRLTTFCWKFARQSPVFDIAPASTVKYSLVPNRRPPLRNLSNIFQQGHSHSPPGY